MKRKQENTAVERRTVPQKLTIQKRADGDEKSLAISGMAALFNSRTELWPGYYEEIAPGAFDDVLQDDVRCLLNHDASMILGRTKSSTCTISQTDTGLSYTCQLPDNALGHQVYDAIERGDIDQSSFAFTIEKESYTDLGDGKFLRIIEKVGQLYDVSPVTFPAYDDASVSVNSRSRFEQHCRALRQKAKPPIKPTPEKGIKSVELARAVLRIHQLNK